MPPITKDLGLVKAILISATAPTNTAMLWYDDTTKLHKYYDTTTLTWKSLLNSNYIISILLADIQVLKNTSTLLEGAFYKITDIAAAGVIVQAVSTSTLSTSCIGLYLVPDFQDVGDYSGLSTPKGNNKGVWFLAGQSGGGAFANDDIVFHNNNMYQVINSSLFDTNTPDLNPSAYSVLAQDVTNGYILEAHDLIWEFDPLTVRERRDSRGNIIGGEGLSFQWGNDNVLGVEDKYNNIDCANQRGTLDKIINLSTDSILISNAFTDTINNCRFGGALNITFNDCGTITGCTFDITGTLTIEDGVTYTDKVANLRHSTFNAELDLSNPAIYAANVLTIPSVLNYIGEFTLNNNNGKTFNKIVNLSTIHKVTRFYIQVGNNQSFQHTTVSTATADLLNSDSATTNAIFGRTDGADYIEYERSGNRNVRVGMVKLV